jgi:hypothetical protein
MSCSFLVLTKIIKIQVPHVHINVFLKRPTKNTTKIYVVPKEIVYGARTKCFNRNLSTKKYHIFSTLSIDITISSTTILFSLLHA